jgi:SAM-dependent methyltransferase
MENSVGHFKNADQIAYWNGTGGQHWVNRQETQDALLAPVLELLIDRAQIQPGERAIDIGCGCGASAIALSKAVGSGGKVLGVDVSAPMLDRARQLTPPELPIEYVHADAMVHHFKAASADLIFSQLGVMFFAEPVRSFLNIRTALRSEGRMIFACWRAPSDNQWITTPLEAAYDNVQRLPPAPLEAPGQFSFASQDRVEYILKTAGLTRIRLERCDISLDLAVGQGLDLAIETAMGFGPVRRAINGQPAEKIEGVRKSMRKALAGFAKGNSVTLPASIWIATARDP